MSEKSLALNQQPKVKTRIENGMFTDMPKITAKDREKVKVYNRATGKHQGPAGSMAKPKKKNIHKNDNSMMKLKINKALKDAGV